MNQTNTFAWQNPSILSNLPVEDFTSSNPIINNHDHSMNPYARSDTTSNNSSMVNNNRQQYSVSSSSSSSSYHSPQQSNKGSSSIRRSTATPQSSQVHNVTENNLCTLIEKVSIQNSTSNNSINNIYVDSPNNYINNNNSYMLSPYRSNESFVASPQNSTSDSTVYQSPNQTLTNSSPYGSNSSYSNSVPNSSISGSSYNSTPISSPMHYTDFIQQDSLNKLDNNNNFLYTPTLLPTTNELYVPNREAISPYSTSLSCSTTTTTYQSDSENKLSINNNDDDNIIDEDNVDNNDIKNKKDYNKLREKGANKRALQLLDYAVTGKCQQESLTSTLKYNDISIKFKKFMDYEKKRKQKAKNVYKIVIENNYNTASNDSIKNNDNDNIENNNINNAFNNEQNGNRSRTQSYIDDDQSKGSNSYYENALTTTSKSIVDNEECTTLTTIPIAEETVVDDNNNIDNSNENINDFKNDTNKIREKGANKRALKMLDYAVTGKCHQESLGSSLKYNDISIKIKKAIEYEKKVKKMNMYSSLVNPDNNNNNNDGNNTTEKNITTSKNKSKKNMFNSSKAVEQYAASHDCIFLNNNIKGEKIIKSQMVSSYDQELDIYQQQSNLSNENLVVTNTTKPTIDKEENKTITTPSIETTQSIVVFENENNTNDNDNDTVGSNENINYYKTNSSKLREKGANKRALQLLDHAVTGTCKQESLGSTLKYNDISIKVKKAMSYEKKCKNNSKNAYKHLFVEMNENNNIADKNNVKTNNHNNGTTATTATNSNNDQVLLAETTRKIVKINTITNDPETIAGMKCQNDIERENAAKVKALHMLSNYESDLA